jgi:tetratricopeptide (TPR) repeat protein
MGQWDAAIEDYNAAIRINPKQVGSLYGRGIAKLKKGDASGNIDIAAAVTIYAKIEQDFKRYGVR